MLGAVTIHWTKIFSVSVNIFPKQMWSVMNVATAGKLLSTVKWVEVTNTALIFLASAYYRCNVLESMYLNTYEVTQNRK